MTGSNNNRVILFMMAILLWSCEMDRIEQGSFEVEVMAYDYAFEAPSELPTGWITFVLNNSMAHEIHEITFVRLPDGVSFEEYVNEYAYGWQVLLNEYIDGVIERTEIPGRAGELLPEWGDGVVYVNARGLVSEGRTASKTIYLEPGNYAIDCWVKTEDGLIHISTGMTRKLTITDDPVNSIEPDPEARITLYEETIDVDWAPETGVHQFAVEMDADENGRPFHNNIHLVRRDDDTDLDAVNTWLDWYGLDGRGLAAPAPADFLGGLSTYDADPGDQAAYFSVDIDEPGSYAWIVQVPEGEQLWLEFDIE